MTGAGRTRLGRAWGAARRLVRREPWWAEFWSAATAIGWSTLALHDMGGWPAMQVLLQLGGERFWHAAGLGLGLAQFGFLLLDHRALRWCGALAMCWFWSVLTLGVWAAVPGAPGVAVYAGWVGANVFSILRLVRPFASHPSGGPHDG